jgi:monoamine oxidase
MSEVQAIRSVLIIGAGIAGISAARELVDAGYDVVVLEARDRCGGRIRTDNSLGVPIDLGAAWIHGKRHNPIAKLCRQNGIVTAPTDYAKSCLIDEKGQEADAVQRLCFAQRANRIMPRLKRLASSLERDISVEQAVKEIVVASRMSNSEMRFLNRQLIEFEAFNGVPLAEQSLFALCDDSLKSHGGDLAFPQGYVQVIDHLARGIKINYNEAVMTVRQEASGVVIVTSTNVHVADAAIVTLPLGVLKSGQVKFVPELPERKQQAISSMKLGLFNKIAIRFEKVFWPVDCDMIELIPETRTHTVQILNWYKYTGEPILVVLTAADTAREWEAKSDAEIESWVRKLLETTFPSGIAKPTGMTITRWGQDEFARGAYVALEPGYKPEYFDFMAEPFGRLYFAGEACIRANYGSVPGAHLSGIFAARRLLHAQSQRLFE